MNSNGRQLYPDGFVQPERLELVVTSKNKSTSNVDRLKELLNRLNMMSTRLDKKNIGR